MPGRNSANSERPRLEWIAVPVPAVASEGTLALVQKLLKRNKHHAQRRTREPTLLHGMLVTGLTSSSARMACSIVNS